MLDCKEFYDALIERDVSFFTGVPDSLLKDICAYITAHTGPGNHVITANEGGAVALAAGHYLATGQPGLVYLQNSGLGNTVNPLTSLADPQVYGIPMVLLLGWRGEPGHKDEPQHVVMGAVMSGLLESIGVRYSVLPRQMSEARHSLDQALDTALSTSAPYAILARKRTFSKFALPADKGASYALTRERAIALLLEGIPPGTPIVATTGKISRELYELRESRGEPHETDLLTVGSMGHSSQIALGVAIGCPEQEVYCFDGDGAVLMHMGGLATIGVHGPRNLKHIVLNNGAHDSVGGQPTVGFDIEIAAMAKACGFRTALVVHDEAALPASLTELIKADGPALLEIRVQKGARADLGRPSMSPAELKRHFMAALR